MKVGVLFSGGKDSAYAAYLAKKEGYEIACLITIESENPDSFMFHTPNVELVKYQADAMGIPLIFKRTKGEKEIELGDLEDAIMEAKNKFKIEGIVSGAIESTYQSSRIQKICNKLDLECFNPLWQKDQFELLNELIKEMFNVIITGVFAYPLNKDWLGVHINEEFIKRMKLLHSKYKINPCGEGGEFESFVLDSPLFKRRLKILDKIVIGEGNSWKMLLEIR